MLLISKSARVLANHNLRFPCNLEFAPRLCGFLGMCRGHVGLGHPLGNPLLCHQCVLAPRTSNGARPKRTGSECVELRESSCVIRRW